MDGPERFVDRSRFQGTLLAKNELPYSQLNSEAGHSRGGPVRFLGEAAGRGRARLGANKTIQPENKRLLFLAKHRQRNEISG